MPVVSEQGSQPGGEGLGVSEGFQLALEAKLALTEVALECGDKLATNRIIAFSRAAPFKRLYRTRPAAPSLPVQSVSTLTRSATVSRYRGAPPIQH